MGDFIIITLMVSSFWLLWEIIRVVSMEWLNRDEITLPAGELGRSELLRCADSFEQLSGMFQGMVTKKEELSGQDMDEVLFRVQTSVCRSCSAAAQCWDYGDQEIQPDRREHYPGERAEQWQKRGTSETMSARRLLFRSGGRSD